MEDSLVCQENIYNKICYVELMGREDYNPWCVGDLRVPLICVCGIIRLTL
jgi:hypothetical protein